MSGNERDHNAPLSKKEIEEESMAQELMDIAMYEEGMSFDDMKKILSIINESRNMAGIEGDGRPAQEAAEYSPDVISSDIPSKSNSIQEPRVKENTLPKPSFSYRQAVENSSTATVSPKSPQDFKPDAESPDSGADMFHDAKAEASVSNTESMFDRITEYSHATEDKGEAKSVSPSIWKNSLNTKFENSQNIHSTDIMSRVKSIPNQRVERWRLNPLNAVVEDNDVPLRSKRRPALQEKVPLRFCHNRRALEVSDKMLEALNNHLDEVAELWRRNQPEEVNEIQLEAPIQVGTDNGSLDKNPATEVTKEQKKCENIHRIPERNCKRKAAEFLKQLADDDESDSDFEIVKTTKKSAKSIKLPKLSNNMEKASSRQDKIFNNLIATKVENPLTVEDYDSDEFDNDDLNSLRRKNAQKQRKANATVVATEIYPRRIEPPNPSKPKATEKIEKPKSLHSPTVKRRLLVRKSARLLKNSEDSNASSTPSPTSENKMSKGLTDDEIANELVNGSIQDKEENDTDIQLKPLPVSGIAMKLSASQMQLKQARKAETKKAQEKKQAELKMMEEEKKQREELIRERWRKEEEQQKQKEAKEAAQKAREELWKNTAGDRLRERKRKELFEKQQREEAEEERLLQDHDDDLIIEPSSSRKVINGNQVNCPICDKPFSAEDIENHAAGCGEFMGLQEPDDSQLSNGNGDIEIDDTNLLVCHICNRYSTQDGIQYEEHSVQCLERKRREAGAGSSNQMILEFPTSPIRSFVPISEQTDSEIDYAAQFPRRVKPPKPRGRRKR